MQIDLTQRSAVVTGGANGIGLATARRLATSGARVAIWDRVAAVGTAAVQSLVDAGLDVIFVEVDVTDTAGVQHAVAETMTRFGRLDILINNAGIVRDAQLVKVRDGVVTGGMSEADFDAVMSVNLEGSVHVHPGGGAPHADPALGAHRECHVGRGGQRNFGQTNYVAAKAGVIGMTKVWAGNWGDAVSP